MTAAGSPGPIEAGVVDGLFVVDGELVGLDPLGGGHIHQTWRATFRTSSGRLERVVCQRLNTTVFTDPERLIANVARVAAFLDGRQAPVAVTAADGEPVARGTDGSRWRAWRYVEGRTVRRFESPGQARAAAGALARLVARLADLPGPTLVEPIAGFHDFALRQAAFEAAVATDPVGRAPACGVEIEGVRRAAALAAELARARAAGLLPERLVHNDAKAENVVFDDDGVEVRAVLDLDTVAPGTVLFDVGDLIRSGAATGPEDGSGAPGGLDVDVEIASAVVEGYVEAVPGLIWGAERPFLALSGPLMAYEAAMRFLTDHLAGDVYFRIAHPGHNLVRARNQLCLVERLEAARPRLGRVTPPVTDVVLDAGPVSRTYRIEGGTVRTVSIRGDKGEVAVAGPELAVVVDGIRYLDADLVLEGAPDQGDGTQLSWTAVTKDGNVQVTVIVGARSDGGVVQKSVVVTGSGRLDRIELELWEGVAVEGFTSIEPGPPPNAGSVELGQPVYGPGFFAGIQHPGAENLATATGCHCSITYGVVLDDVDAVPSPVAVIGAGDFFHYLERLRPHPDRVVVLTNNWYHLGWPGTMSEATVRDELLGFGGVTARHGLEIDHFCLDDGWDGGWSAGTDLDDLWARLDPPRFPGALAALEEALGRGRIGLWVGPFGGYGDRQVARVAFARERGAEVDEHGLLCVAGDAYHEALRETFTRWTAAGIRYWKLDGVRFTCSQPGHGHPVGDAGRTVQMDRFMRLLVDALAADPNVVIVFTTGSNPSPWWLGAADFLWRGGLDDSGTGYPGPRHESFATYVDARLHLYRRCSVPTSVLVTFSVVESDACRYRDLDEDIVDWERHCWLMVGRGTQHHDLYVAPDSLSEPEWDALARALAWSRQHRRLLGHSRMVLGDPASGQIYGFAAHRQGEGVLCLRNPAAVVQTVRVVPAEMFGFDADAPIDLALVFGPTSPPTPVLAGRALEIELEPFEVLLLMATSNDLRPALQAVVDRT